MMSHDDSLWSQKASCLGYTSCSLGVMSVSGLLYWDTSAKTNKPSEPAAQHCNTCDSMLYPRVLPDAERQRQGCGPAMEPCLNYVGETSQFRVVAVSSCADPRITGHVCKTFAMGC